MYSNQYYKLILFLLLFLISPQIKAQNNEIDTVIYSQKVNRFRTFFEVWDLYRGELKLKNNTIEFSPRNKKGRGSFILEYDEIVSIKKRNALLIIPNYIVLIDKNYVKYKIGTYKRKKIVEIIESKIQN